jgi:hypothetical protein
LSACLFFAPSAIGFAQPLPQAERSGLAALVLSQFEAAMTAFERECRVRIYAPSMPDTLDCNEWRSVTPPRAWNMSLQKQGFPEAVAARQNIARSLGLMNDSMALGALLGVKDEQVINHLLDVLRKIATENRPSNGFQMFPGFAAS